MEKGVTFSKPSGLFVVLQDLVEDSVKGELSKEEYPYVKEPSGPMPTTQAADPNGQPAGSKNAAIHSRRTNRPTGSTWANKGRNTASNDDSSKYLSSPSLSHSVFLPHSVFLLSDVIKSEHARSVLLSMSFGASVSIHQVGPHSFKNISRF